MASSLVQPSFQIILNPECCEDVWNVENCVSSDHVYKPGGQVEGKLKIVLQEPLNFSGIYIKVHGRMFVGFNLEDSPEIPVSHDVMLEGKEYKDYKTEKELVLLPSKQVFGDALGHCQVLQPGEHQFPFKFDIPTNVPSSFDGYYGFIEYWIDAAVNQIPFGLGWRSRKDIIIHGFYDLNTEPSAMLPVELSKEKTFRNLCCQNNTFSYSLFLPKRGFTHGEQIQPSIQLQNQTSSETQAVLSLSKKVIYKVRGKSVTEEMMDSLDLVSVTVDSHSSIEWRPSLLIFEQLPPSMLTECPNIQVHYELMFQFGPVACCTWARHCKVFTILVGHTEGLPSCDLVTEPQMYIHPAVDLSASSLPDPEGRYSLPPPYEKGDNPLNHGYLPMAQPTAPLVIHQPSSSAGLPAGDHRPAPPSYSQTLAMTDLSVAHGSSHEMQE